MLNTDIAYDLDEFRFIADPNPDNAAKGWGCRFHKDISYENAIESMRYND